jgi:hypothetical protein
MWCLGTASGLFVGQALTRSRAHMTLKAKPSVLRATSHAIKELNFIFTDATA